MAKNYCVRFTEDIFRKYKDGDTDRIKAKSLKNEFSGKHQPAALQHFNAKYI